ncbi:uncharacterized protein LOC128599043 isoform X2 [Ictalurus furcatus]|nr:uncharacterized protein LOC128599043 isoform X2 [Ictalurus furcatus]XP_053466360.1 uncharacterized protein LOC128599043 isoform X2 [Ictalurus furcatus]
MHLCAAVILPLLPCVVLSLDRQMVFGNLDESASLPCTVQCSGELTWTRFQKQDDVLVRCSSVSCWVKHRFILPYEQYLNGNSSLTMLKAAYSLRGLYMAKCVSETVCEVVFTLSPLEMTHVITPGEPIDVYLPLTDMVEVIFTASGAVQPSHPQICTVDKEKIQCSPEYKERASLLNTLQIKDGDVSDSGNYTVRDKVNDETLAIVTVHMRGSEPEQPSSGAAPVSQTRVRGRRSVSSEENPCPEFKQERSMPAWGITLIALMSLVMAVMMGVIVYQPKEIQQLQKNPADTELTPTQTNGDAKHNPGEELEVLTHSSNTGS